MSTTDRQTESPTGRAAGLAVWGAAVAAAVAAGAAMLAAPGTAAPTVMGWNLHAKGELEAPKLEHGVLRIKGRSGAGELIAPRLQAGQPGFLQVDAGGDTDAVQVEGLRAAVSILHPEGGFDRLEINGLGGPDRVANDLQAWTIGLFVDGVAVP